MDRAIVYAGAIPLDTDLLATERYVQIGFGMAMQAILGTSTAVDGLACTQNSPTGLTVLVGPGSMYSYQNTDATAFGSLAADTTHSIVKQGVLYDTVTLSCAAPGTAGQSINYLIQASFSEVDDTPVVLPYYNSANPSVAYSGPGGAGTSQNTARRDKIVVTAKAGTAATTGSQTTPSPDAGYVGLYSVTVANGQSSILNANITQLATAPFISAKLPAVPAATQNGSWVYGADTGTVNAMVLTLTPAVTAYQAGQSFEIKVGNTNTGATTLNVNGLGAKSVVRGDGTALQAGDIAAGTFLYVSYDGTNFQVVAKSAALDTIDTAITRTVHGAGGDFSDLYAAMAWLSRRRIGANGSVTLNIAAGQWTYASQLTLYHPDGQRIFINGAAMSASLTLAGFACTGNSSGSRTTDNANNLTYLRGKYTTELRFTNGTGINVYGVFGQLDQLLITSDGTTVTGQSGLLYAQLGAIALKRVSIHGYATNGIVGYTSYITVPTGGFLSSTGNGLNGIVGQSGGAVLGTSISGTTTIYSGSNAGDGVQSSNGGTVQATFAGSGVVTMVSQGNGGSGFSAYYGSSITLQASSGSKAYLNASNGFAAINGSNMNAVGSTAQSNGAAGVYSAGGSYISCNSSTLTANLYGVYASGNAGAYAQSCTYSANTSTAITATGGSTVDATSSSGSPSLSPAVNTVGNSNSIIIG